MPLYCLVGQADDETYLFDEDPGPNYELAPDQHEEVEPSAAPTVVASPVAPVDEPVPPVEAVEPEVTDTEKEN